MNAWPTRRRIGALVVLGTVVVALLSAVSSAAPQGRRNRGGRGGYVPINSEWMYDGRFIFCRMAFRGASYGDGGSWYVDYPRADLNLPFRMGQLTTVPISRDSRGEPNHVIVTPADPHLFECPFVMMTEVGSLYLSAEEAAQLRVYLEKGGFIWADDFWGEYAWQVWENEIRKVFPAGAFPIKDLPLSHPIFHTVYNVPRIPQIPSINSWFGSGFQTSERGQDSATPHVRAVTDDRGRIMVLITHNTDFGDAFEREGDNRAYFDRFAGEGYAFGINAVVYALTH